MTLYTLSGFPTMHEMVANKDPSLKQRYRDIQANELSDQVNTRHTLPFDQELDVTVTCVDILNKAGNPFKNLMLPNVVVSPSITSLLIETVEIISGNRKNRMVSLHDFSSILSDQNDSIGRRVTVTKEHYDLLSLVAKMENFLLVANWVRTLGIYDLVAFCRLYVGSDDATNVMAS